MAPPARWLALAATLMVVDSTLVACPAPAFPVELGPMVSLAAIREAFPMAAVCLGEAGSMEAASVAQCGELGGGVRFYPADTAPKPALEDAQGLEDAYECEIRRSLDARAEDALDETWEQSYLWLALASSEDAWRSTTTIAADEFRQTAAGTVILFEATVSDFMDLHELQYQALQNLPEYSMAQSIRSLQPYPETFLDLPLRTAERTMKPSVPAATRFNGRLNPEESPEQQAER